MSSILRTEKLSKFFGGLRALRNVDLEVRAHEILGMIGPNGAGKTTFFNTVCGVYAPDGGNVFLEGREITGMPTHRIARMGIGQDFSDRQTLHEYQRGTKYFGGIGQRSDEGDLTGPSRNRPGKMSGRGSASSPPGGDREFDRPTGSHLDPRAPEADGDCPGFSVETQTPHAG